MLDILEIREHANRAADNGRPMTECPFAITSIGAVLWRDFYWARQRWTAEQGVE